MKELIYLSGPYLGCVLMFFFLRQVFPAKVGTGKMLLYLTPMFLGQLPKYLFGSSSTVAQVCAVLSALLACTVFPLLILEGNKWKTVGCTFFLYALQMLADCISYGIFSPRFGLAGEEYTAVQIAAYQGVVWVVYVPECSACVFMLRAITMRRFQSYYLLFLAFPLGQCYLAFCCANGIQNFFWVFSVLLELAAELGLLTHTIAQEKRAALEKEVSGAKRVLELEHAHYREVEARQEEMACIRHDFKNQLSAIGRLIRQGEEADAQRMIRQLSEEIGKTKANPYCGIPVVNAILTEKARACGEAGVGLEVELDIPRGLNVEPMHLCSIFSNLLDNAIRGAAESGTEDPTVRLTSMVEGDYLFIKTVNPAKPPKKKRQKGHGYGQQILRDIASQYGGEYRGEYESGGFTAVVSLLANGIQGERP